MEPQEMVGKVVASVELAPGVTVPSDELNTIFLITFKDGSSIVADIIDD